MVRPYVRRNCIACLLTVPDDGSGSADLELAARARYFFRSVQPKEDFLLSAEIRKRATLTNHFCRNTERTERSSFCRKRLLLFYQKTIFLWDYFHRMGKTGKTVKGARRNSRLLPNTKILSISMQKVFLQKGSFSWSLFISCFNTILIILKLAKCISNLQSIGLWTFCNLHGLRQGEWRQRKKFCTVYYYRPWNRRWFCLERKRKRRVECSGVGADISQSLSPRLTSLLLMFFRTFRFPK